MKAVLLSIKREWARKILSGEKTIEIRKTKPNLTPPFRVFMYETQADGGQGAVIGSFVCDWIRRLDYYEVGGGFWEDGRFKCVDPHGDNRYLYQNSKLSISELRLYAKGKNPYGWHITKVEASPRIDLNVFNRPCPPGAICRDGVNCLCCRLYDREKCICTNPAIKRPPQSWCYVDAF